MGILNVSVLRPAMEAAGSAAASARLHVFDAGSEIMVPLYRDEQLTHLTANPVTASQSGTFPFCYVENGVYCLEVRDTHGRLITRVDDVAVISPFVAEAPHQFASVTELVADLALSYTPGEGRFPVVAGNHVHVTRGQFTYRVLAGTATNHDLQTAGGVRLKALSLVGNDTGAFSPEQFGAVAASKLYEDVVNRRWCLDAALTKPAPDSTAALQACFDAADVIVGGGGHYMVTEVEVSSDTAVHDLYLYERGNSADVQYSPLYIGRDNTFGRTSSPVANIANTRRNILIENVHIHGGRALQTNLSTADGGRYGFRIRGYVDNLTLRDCSANYCATDGIEIHRGVGTNVLATGETDAQIRASNIRVTNCRFDWNRRHGGSGNSMQNVRFEDCSFEYNGLNVDGTWTPRSAGSEATDGKNGILSAGDTYGNGWDMEAGASGSTGGRVVNITFKGCRMRKNVRDSALFFDPVDQAQPDFQSRESIFFIDCLLDAGQNNTNGNYALTFTSNITRKDKLPVYRNVQVINCDILGAVTARSVSGFILRGGRMIAAVPANGYGVFDYATGVRISPSESNITYVGSVTTADVFLERELVGQAPFAGCSIAAGATLLQTLNVPGVTSDDFVEVVNTSITGASFTHVYVLTARGAGKTTSLQNQIYAVLKNEHGVAKTLGPGCWYWRVTKAPAITEFVSNPAFATGLVAGGNKVIALSGLVVGGKYKLSYATGNHTTGTVTPTLAGTVGTAATATGFYNETLTCGTGTMELRFDAGTGFNGAVSDVSLVRVS